MIEKLVLKIRNVCRNVNNKIRNKWKKGYKLPKKVKYFEGSLYDAIFESALKYPMNTAKRLIPQRISSHFETKFVCNHDSLFLPDNHRRT